MRTCEKDCFCDAMILRQRKVESGRVDAVDFEWEKETKNDGRMKRAGDGTGFLSTSSAQGKMIFGQEETL